MHWTPSFGIFCTLLIFVKLQGLVLQETGHLCLRLWSMDVELEHSECQMFLTECCSARLLKVMPRMKERSVCSSEAENLQSCFYGPAACMRSRLGSGHYRLAG